MILNKTWVVADAWIGNLGLFPSMASESRYKAMPILVAEFKKILFSLHTKSEVSSHSMRLLQEMVEG